MINLIINWILLIHIELMIIKDNPSRVIKIFLFFMPASDLRHPCGLASRAAAPLAARSRRLRPSAGLLGLFSLF